MEAIGITMSLLETSHRACLNIAQSSGSNFYRAFGFLRLDRRQAMTALYAFSRLADDATDAAPLKSTASSSSSESNHAWEPQRWLEWIDGLGTETSINLDQEIGQLEEIRVALIDSLERFKIPKECLKQIVQGVDRDTMGLRVENYQQLQEYMFGVASAVGLSCIAIWSSHGAPQAGTLEYRMAVDCGHAFQLTNILRDILEDAQRDRMYLADEDLERMGFTRNSLIESLKISDPSLRKSTIQKQGDWPGLMRLYLQRTAACYANGWGVSTLVDRDSLRMFSMIWNTYHRIFRQLQKDPWACLLKRTTLGTASKLKLYASHAFTPWFRRISQPHTRRLYRLDAPISTVPKVAVIGGGLAGIQTAMHLAKHGCQTWLIESRNRLGGRVGSFSDSKSRQEIDYCQHVGMKCCSELSRWIVDFGQAEHWQEQSTLCFRSRNGKPFQAAAWPLPAPLHLTGLLLKWPDLSLVDRAAIAWGLMRLIRTRPDRAFENQMAIDWLVLHGQTKNAIDRFWATVLVSALGEQLPRITMGSVHKVIIDGFAASKDGYHLLVPQKSLSELVDLTSKDCLSKLQVRMVQGKTVVGLERSKSGNWSVQTRSLAQAPDSEETHEPCPEFDAVVLAVPWHRFSQLVSSLSDWAEPELPAIVDRVQQLQSAPITGVHTWWSKPWFKAPHAILIDRFSQWIFPGPSEKTSQVDRAPEEHYLQVVISGSRDLPKGDADGVLRSIEEDLKAVFPELRESGAVLLRGKVITDPQSVFSVNAGHSEARIEQGIFGDHGLFIAGDWTATGWPATMEGALRSGSLAASGVLDYVGRPAELSLDGR